MEQTKNKNNLKNWLILIVLVNVFLKLFNLSSTPPAATYDEIIYISEAQSIVKYGTDLTGNWRPWNLAPSDAFYTELTSTVLVPGFILFPNNPILASKFTPLLIGILLPAILGLIVFRITKSKLSFIVTAIFTTFNPWLFQFSRMGYDSFFSVGFYSIGIFILLSLKNYRKLWAIIPFFFGFYQYQGHKPLLAPMVLLSLLFLIFEKYKYSDFFNTTRTLILKNFKNIIKDKNIISGILVLVFSIIITVTYLIRLPHLKSGERAVEFSIYNESEISQQVNLERQQSLDNGLSRVFINKYTVIAKLLTQRFLNSFDHSRLFIEGNRVVDTFSVLDYGYFHIVDIIIIIISLIYLKDKNKLPLLFVITFILIGTLPNVIRTGTPWIIFRGAFSFIGILFLMGIGFSNFLSTLKTKQIYIIIFIYILLTTPFLFIYFYRYPITHATHTSFYERVLASYIKRVGNEEKILILPDRADATFDYLISYNQLLNDENKNQVNTSANNKVYNINNIDIASNCPIDINESQQTTFVYIFKQPCEPKVFPEYNTKIKSLIDGGLIFMAYNDKLCSQYDLGTYPNIKKNVLAVEELSDKEFCQSFFSKDLK